MKPLPCLTGPGVDQIITRPAAAQMLRTLRRQRAEITPAFRIGCIYIPGFTLHIR